MKWFEIGPDLVHDDRDGENDEEALSDYEKDLRFKPGVPGNQFKFHDDDDVIWNEIMKKKKLAAERREVKGPGSRLLKMKWDRDRDDSKAKRCIAELAVLLSHLRCDVQTWTEGSDIGFSPSLQEHPQRAAEILFILTKGHALLYGRNYVTMEDILIAVKTVLSTAQIDRVKLFSLLLANKGRPLFTSDIINSLNISPKTARRKMVEFRVIGLVDDEYSGSSHELYIKIKPEFEWFLSEEFDEIREGFEPADYRKYLKEDNNNNITSSSEMAEQETPTFNANATAQAETEKIAAFDIIFDQLARESESSAKMEADKGTVGRDDLQKRLVASGSGLFNLAQALTMIDEMLRIKKIKIVMLNTYRRNDSYDNEKETAS